MTMLGTSHTETKSESPESRERRLKAELDHARAAYVKEARKVTNYRGLVRRESTVHSYIKAHPQSPTAHAKNVYDNVYRAWKKHQYEAKSKNEADIAVVDEVQRTILEQRKGAFQAWVERLNPKWKIAALALAALVLIPVFMTIGTFATAAAAATAGTWALVGRWIITPILMRADVQSMLQEGEDPEAVGWARADTQTISNWFWTISTLLIGGMVRFGGAEQIISATTGMDDVASKELASSHPFVSNVEAAVPGTSYGQGEAAKQLYDAVEGAYDFDAVYTRLHNAEQEILAKLRALLSDGFQNAGESTLFARYTGNLQAFDMLYTKIITKLSTIEFYEKAIQIFSNDPEQYAKVWQSRNWPPPAEMPKVIADFPRQISELAQLNNEARQITRAIEQDMQTIRSLPILKKTPSGFVRVASGGLDAGTQNASYETVPTDEPGLQEVAYNPRLRGPQPPDMLPPPEFADPTQLQEYLVREALHARAVLYELKNELYALAGRYPRFSSYIDQLSEEIDIHIEKLDIIVNLANSEAERNPLLTDISSGPNRRAFAIRVQADLWGPYPRIWSWMVDVERGQIKA